MITVTIPSTGETLALPQISVAMLKSQLTRKHPKPAPPKQKVVMFGEERWEENPDAAGYADTLKTWEAEINELVAEVILRKIAYNQPPMSERQITAVTELRQQFGDILDIPADDRLAWLMNCAITDSDMEPLFMSVVTQKNQFSKAKADDIDTLAAGIETHPLPIDAEVDAYAEMFRVDVP